MTIGMLIALLRNSLGADARTLKFTDPESDGSIKITVVSTEPAEQEG